MAYALKNGYRHIDAALYALSPIPSTTMKTDESQDIWYAGHYEILQVKELIYDRQRS